MIDGSAILIDSYQSPRELIDHFYQNFSRSAKVFVAEMTGEITWKNASCGFNNINRR